MQVRRLRINPGVNITFLDQEKFNTTSLVLVIKNKVDKSKIDGLPFLAALLTNASKKYPSTAEINHKKEELFDLRMNAYSSIQGKYQNLFFGLNFIDQSFIRQADYLENIVDFLLEIILKPFVDEEGFDPTYFEQQKSIYISQLRTLDNEKESFAANHIKDMMHFEHPLKYNNFGDYRVIQKMTRSELYRHYLEIINNEIAIYVCGKLPKNKIVSLLKDKFGLVKREKVKPSSIVKFNVRKSSLKIVKSNFGQSQVIIRYALPIFSNDLKVYSAIVFNALFGGTPLSKLFKVIREEFSLCYSIDSNYMDYYGVIDVHAGFDAQKYSLLNELIEAQIEGLILGNFSDLELQQTKNLLVNKYRRRHDSGMGIISSYFNADILKSEAFRPEQLIAGIESVSKQDIQKCASLLERKLTYFVKQREGENHD